ncbi:hypothetical protein ABLO18_16065 [Mycobacterium tuberculosis]
MIPAFGGAPAIPISVGPITISPITLFPVQNFNTTFLCRPSSLAWGSSTFQESKLKDLYGNVTLQLGNLNIHDLNYQSFPVTVNWSTPAATIFPNGISIPNNPLVLLASASIGTRWDSRSRASPFLRRAAAADDRHRRQIDGFSTPPITIDRIPLNLGASVGRLAHPINGVNIPATLPATRLTARRRVSFNPATVSGRHLRAARVGGPWRDRGRAAWVSPLVCRDRVC